MHFVVGVGQCGPYSSPTTVGYILNNAVHVPILSYLQAAPTNCENSIQDQQKCHLRKVGLLFMLLALAQEPGGTGETCPPQYWKMSQPNICLYRRDKNCTFGTFILKARQRRYRVNMSPPPHVKVNPTPLVTDLSKMIHCRYTPDITFTFMHLANAFIQSNF